MFYIIFGALFAVLEFLIGLLPVLNTSHSFSGVISDLLTLLYQSSFFIPYDFIFICLGLIISYYVTLALTKAVTWLIHRIPQIG